MKNTHVSSGLRVGVVILLVFSVVTPMVIGYDEEMRIKKVKNRNDNLEIFNIYNLSELSPVGYTSSEIYEVSEKTTRLSQIRTKQENNPPTVIANGPMDSPWSMYCHDTRHTGRSPYSTVDTWDEIWHVKDETYYMLGSPVIADDGTIYCSSLDFYAVHPNGTVKWKYDDWDGYPWAAPAIDENGTIYIGLMYAYSSKDVHAFYPNGTVKWGFKVGDCVHSSPAIGTDGTIYFGSENKNLYALYPNGTLRWKFTANHIVFSSPAIGSDGTIYFGSIDRHVYALCPNNGTLKWKFNTGNWIHGSAAIGDDGTVYIGSDVNFYALYPNNGTMKWKLGTGAIWCTPVIDEEGIIYVGDSSGVFHAIYPNGTIKWRFNTGGGFWFGASAAISAEGTLYFGTTSFIGGSGNFFALNPDGTEKWRFSPGWYESSPAIGEDGIVYMTSCNQEEHGGGIYSKGYLYAFGVGELEADADGPYYGLVDIPVEFQGSSSGGYSPHTYFWDFGDGGTSDEQNPIHAYIEDGNYTVTLTVTDNTSNSSSDTSWAWIQTSNDPPNKPSITGETHGNVETSYDYTFTAADPDESIIWYYVDWGDGSNSGWVGSYNSGTTITKSHKWTAKGTYNISAKAKDPYDAEGPWGYLEVEMPVNNQNSQMQSSSQQSMRSLFFQILEKLLSHPKLIK